jgi:hypothetical protein
MTSTSSGRRLRVPSVQTTAMMTIELLSETLAAMKRTTLWGGAQPHQRCERCEPYNQRYRAVDFVANA